MKICVIGGGPVGLYAATQLSRRGIEVSLFEEHKEIGIPCHCAGVVSPKVPNMVGVPLQRVVEGELRGVRLGIPGKIDMEYVDGDVKALVIDRVRFDRVLAEASIREGVNLYLGARIGVEGQDEDGVLVEGVGFRKKFPLVLDAGGVSSLMMRRGIDGRPLRGVQMDVEGSDQSPEIVEIWIDKGRNDEFFLWSISLPDGVVRVGTASSKDPSKILEDFIAWRFPGGRMRGRRSGLLWISGYTKSFVDGRIVYAGDSAGQTKPTTGGGLRYGLSGAEEASEAIANHLKGVGGLSSYGDRWMRLWRREVDLQRMAQRILWGMGEESLIELLEVVKKEEILSLLISQGDMDLQHSLLQILARNKRLLGFGIRFLSHILGDYI